MTPAVKREVVDRPMKIKKFKLEAMRVQDMIERGIFKMSGDIVEQGKLEREKKRIFKIANGVLRTTHGRKKMTIIHDGETASLAFANLCGCENIIVIDERTTRMLTEAPGDLEKMMERKLHTPLDANLDLLKELKGFRFIRSAELLFVAWKKGLVMSTRNSVPSKLGTSKEIPFSSGARNKDLLDALLYGVKFKGCAISSGEIEDMKKLAS